MGKIWKVNFPVRKDGGSEKKIGTVESVIDLTKILPALKIYIKQNYTVHVTLLFRQMTSLYFCYCTVSSPNPIQPIAIDNNVI